MKKITFIISLFYISLSLSAQKQVRKEIRSGNKAYKEQRYETAQEHYQKAIDTNASSKEASFNLSNTYFKQQQWDNALKEYQHYLTVETEKPENMSSAWYNTGNTYLKKKVSEHKQQSVPQPQQGEQQPDNLKMSMEAYKNALRLNPKDDEARYNLAVVQKMIQDQQQNGGGGQDNQQDKKDDKKDNQDKQQDKQNNQDKQQDKQDKQEKQNQDRQQKQEQQQNQMSQQNMEQILNAIEQDERGTQDRVQKQKAEERKQKNQDNKRQNKDW